MGDPSRNRTNFALLWVGQLVSQFGDAIFHVAFIWLALDLTGSNATTGLIATAGYLPAILLSLAAGVMADRLDRRRLMIACAALQAVVVAAVPVMDRLGGLSGPSLALVAFGLSAGAAFFNPARDALIPRLVPREGLNRANSLVQVSAQLAFMAGPAAAGALLAWVGIMALFTFNAGTFVFSLMTLWLIRLPTTSRIHLEAGPVPLPQVPTATSSTLTEIKAGLSMAWSDGRLRGLLLLTAVDNLIIMGPAIVGTPIYVRETLGYGSEGASAYAALIGIFFVGMVLMSLVISWRGRHWPKGKMILLGIFLDGVTFIPFFFIETIELACLAMFIHGLTVPLLTVPRATLVQEVVPDQSRGRMFALLNLAVVGFTALSTGLTGFLAEWISMPVLYLIIGVLGTACGVAGLAFKDLRQAR
jgi:DHA3 family macrolide efflux protein-like MFS transporter